MTQTTSYLPQFRVRSDVRSGASAGGFVNGVFYPDMSGVCGGVVPPTPVPPTPTPVPPVGCTGGFINGICYPDRSGFCG